MRPPTVSFLGGVREIGGNKILVEDGPDRVLFDFGPSFSPQIEQYYVDYLQPRSTSPAKDLLEFGLLPRLGGLYSREALADADLAYRAPEVTAVFVSHAHADHAGYLRLIDPAIPVHVGAGTKALLDAIGTTTRMKYGEHDHWELFADRSPIRVGRIEVVPYPVDHSIPFAYGFLVRTSEGTLAYTGDFRHHGPRADDTHRFFAAVGAEPVDALLIEGTRAGPDPRRNLSEDGVRRAADGVIDGHDALALACTYPRDLDRLRTLHDAARAAHRSLVVSTRTAHLLAQIAPRLPPGAIPVPGRTEGIAVYARRKRLTGLWERPFLDGAVPAEELRAHGRQYLLALDFAQFTELIDLRPPKGSPFLHSMSEPFSEDDVSDQVMHNWLDHFGLVFHQLHASGHASGPELLQLVRASGARTVYPIHTEHPEAFAAAGPAACPPELGIAYPIGAADRPPRGTARPRD
ncbi:MAG TPA: MBL fold metallo-hydrolase [Thermoplasmata archaeon]|nr:MBL fold metallo-hydrolase [Thermoplasmata archaeon]